MDVSLLLFVFFVNLFLHPCQGFINVIEKSFIREENIEILKLFTADERKNAFFYYNLEDLPLKMKLLKLASEGKDIQTFQFSEDKLEEIIGFVIVIGNSENNIVVYKQRYSISLLKRDKYMLTPISHYNRLKRYKGDILRVDFNYQIMMWNDTFYIADIDKMEKYVHFMM